MKRKEIVIVIQKMFLCLVLVQRTNNNVQFFLFYFLFAGKMLSRQPPPINRISRQIETQLPLNTSSFIFSRTKKKKRRRGTSTFTENASKVIRRFWCVDFLRVVSIISNNFVPTENIYCRLILSSMR